MAQSIVLSSGCGKGEGVGTRSIGAAEVVRAILNRQYLVIARHQALGAGYSPSQVDQFVASGHWTPVFRGVYRPGVVELSAHGWLMAACLATTARASHESAGWLWGFLRTAPRQPVVTVSPSRANGHPGITIHRAGDLPRVAGTWCGIIPTTSPARTLVDLAAVLDDADLDAAVDRAVALQKAEVPDIDRALRHARGRRGAAALRRSLQRGYAEGPAPSVLEARFARLLKRHGLHAERERPVTWEWARYRLDFLVEGKLPAEVDGFAYHATVGDFIRDRHRRNDLKLAGRDPLVFTWWDIDDDPGRVVDDILRGLAQLTARGA